MEVRTDCYVENMADGTRHMINTAYFVMIALDTEGKPVRVPRLELKTISEQAEWAAGEKRQQLRKQRMREGF